MDEIDDNKDPQIILRIKSRESKNCRNFVQELMKCEKRTLSNSEEDCSQELYDLIKCVDECVTNFLFHIIRFQKICLPIFIEHHLTIASILLMKH